MLEREETSRTINELRTTVEKVRCVQVIQSCLRNGYAFTQIVISIYSFPKRMRVLGLITPNSKPAVLRPRPRPPQL